MPLPLPLPLPSGDVRAYPKPHPEAFLPAAQRLGVAAADCLVFEDTDLGIRAATAAGMAAVRVPAPWERATAA